MKAMVRLVLFVSMVLVGVSQVSAQIWTRVSTDIDGEAAGDQCGYSVSLSADGCRIVIGAPGNDGNGSHSGHVRIFDCSEGSWTQLGTDVDGCTTNDSFGCSVALSADGSRVVIGAPYSSRNGVRSGYARIFEYSEGSWVQLGADIEGEGARDHCGESVSISSDGSRVAVGIPTDSGWQVGYGNVRIFEYLGGNWTQLGGNIQGTTGNDELGSSVSLSADGSRVAIGAPQEYGGSGYVRIFEYSGGRWTQLGADIYGEIISSSNKSGSSSSLNADGTCVAIGDPNNDANTSDPNDNRGHVRVFEYSDGSWTQLGPDIDGEEAGDRSGSSVSLSADGIRVAVGAPDNDGNGSYSGHARIFHFSTVTEVNFKIVGRGVVSPLSGNYEFGTNLNLMATADVSVTPLL